MRNSKRKKDRQIRKISYYVIGMAEKIVSRLRLDYRLVGQPQVCRGEMSRRVTGGGVSDPLPDQYTLLALDLFILILTSVGYARAFGDGILNHGQVTWTTPELEPPSPNYHTTPTREDVSDLTCIAALHGGSLVVLGSNS
ncbi:hypothetical protein TNCV_4642781 [Trichonephila clavipes]|nr:hypothetical protein TNCV_4642781 [Trichonephila clavipes]